MYTIEVIKWDKHLHANSYVYQTVKGYEYYKMSKKIEEECKVEMKNGDIRDYRITRYEHE